VWVGGLWFNAGDALGAHGGAVSAFVATHCDAWSGGRSWMVAEWVRSGKPTVLGLASGVIAGLATITPGAGFLGPLSALVVGLLAGVLCYMAVVWKTRLGYDDSLDVVGIHGVGGFTGIVATGLLASVGGATGLFFGNPDQFVIQLVLGVATLLFAVVGTYIILKVVDGIVGLRIAPEEETIGLDLSQHNERAYS